MLDLLRRFLAAAPPAVSLALVGLVALPCAVKAERQHTVRGGQNMVTIAKQYGVTVWTLAAANGLRPDQQVREGKVLAVPDRGVVYVNEGQSLWGVARRHHVSVDDLARANDLKATSTLRAGMRLVLPGGPKGGGEAKAASEKRWGKPKQQGKVTFYRAATQKRLLLTLTDTRGRVRPEASRQLSVFLRPKDSKKTKTPARRLLSVLGQTSDHFGGRVVHVISGYRLAGGYTSHGSRHVQGHAIDFRIEGVPNGALRDYLRHFDDVGVGFYPHSSFVHLDVRDKNAYWVDTSGPGQQPNYLARGERDSFSEAERQDKGESIADVVEAALEEMAHEEPDEAESDDE